MGKITLFLLPRSRIVVTPENKASPTALVPLIIKVSSESFIES